MDKKTSIIRSIRMSKELNLLLEQEAEEQRLAFNALVNRIITKYVQWDRQLDKFGFVTMASESLKSILNHCSDEMLEMVGRELGTRMTPQTTMFWQKDASFQGYLQMITLYSRYSGQFTVEKRKDDSILILTFHHDLGPKWSVLLKSFVEASLEILLPKTERKVESTGNLVVAHAKLPINMSP